MADAVVARPWMHCQGHVAHGTSRLYHLVLVSTQFTQPRTKCSYQLAVHPPKKLYNLVYTNKKLLTVTQNSTVVCHIIAHDQMIRYYSTTIT